MQLINKIEIRNFRSFLGTTKDDAVEIVDITHLNIFSGSNDSGKSNILRALNLFFNEEIDYVHKFNFDNDFNILKKDKIQKVIEIKLYFNLNGREFSISKFYDRNGYRNFEYKFKNSSSEEIVIDSRYEINKKKYEKTNPNIFKKERNFRSYASGLISSVSFSYIPAIKEEQFYTDLIGKILYQIKKEEEIEIDGYEKRIKKIINWQKTKDNKTENFEFKKNVQNKKWRENEKASLTEKIKSKSVLQNSIVQLEKDINQFSDSFFSSVSFLQSEFKVNNSLTSFFRSFDIATGLEKDISLKLRGDGMQAKFIPEMLNFFDRISSSKKFFIWGFEEPENSSEYKNQTELAYDFKNKFIEDKQLFITTHSEEFLSLYDDQSIEKEKRKANLYHVKKTNNKKYKEFSIVELFNVETQVFQFANVFSDIEEALGASIIRAKHSKELKKIEDDYLEKIKIETEKSKRLEIELNNLDKNVLWVEGDFEEKLFNKLFVTSTFIVKSANCANNVRDNLISSIYENPKSRLILGLFDFDFAGKGCLKEVRSIKKNNQRHNSERIKAEYIEPNDFIKSLLTKIKINYTIDDLMPDFVWKYLMKNDYLEDDDEKYSLRIPIDQSKYEFIKEKLDHEMVSVTRCTKRIKSEKKSEYQRYILSLNENELLELKRCLQPTWDKIELFFKSEIN